MIRRRLLPSLACLFAAVLIGGCTAPSTPPPAPAAAAPEPPPRPSPYAEADALLARMTLEQKIGQIMIIGFTPSTYDPGLRELIEKHHVGGVIFFARNVVSPAQMAQLTNELQASALATGHPGLFLAIDQEGGRVARLTTGMGFTEFPGAMAIGATSPDPKRAAVNSWLVGKAMAEEIRAIGLNVNFAPDLDVNNNPANPVIGIRSYSSDPQRVSTVGVGMIDGLQGAGVLAFGKHFPGHGDTGTDSHADLPIVAHARARLDTVEFVPFKAAISAGVAGIMSAHISFPTIDTTPRLPGTLSPKVLTDLLRRDFGFDGLIVTDSLEMGALEKSGFPAPKAAARALAAGADILLFNAGFPLHRAAIEQIAADVKSGVIPQARLDEAVRRVLIAKSRFNILHPTPVDPAAAALVCNSVEHQALAARFAAAAVTLVRDDAGRLPLAKGVAPIVIGPPVAARLAEMLQGTDVRISESPTAAESDAALRVIRAKPNAPVVLVLAGGQRAQAEFAKRLVTAGVPVIALALREPYDLLFASGLPARNAPTLLATYGVNPATTQALVAVLKGEARPAGRLPVELPGLFPIGAGRDDFGKR